MRTLPRTLLSASVAATLALLSTATATAPAAARTDAQATTPQITYTQWDTQRQLAAGRFLGTRAVGGAVQLATPVGTTQYTDPHGYGTRQYAFGRWVSPWATPGHAFDQLIPSWDASTPGASWVQVQVRGRSDSGRVSKWYTMANWAAGDTRFHRTSRGAQADDLAQVDVDTLKTRYSTRFTSWQTRVSLFRRVGTTVSPSVDTIGAVTSLLPPAGSTVPTSQPGVARGRSLDLPSYSQMIHKGDYPEYDAGGEAWCSPTSVSMVLGHLGRLPRPRQYAWVPTGHPDRWVDHAARSQYDYGYDGTGNWSFSVAYAATRADSAFVTRLRSLRQAERFIAAGIPVVASVRFGRDQLDGAPIRSTNGHLLVISGFTATGDVVVHDPAGPNDSSVVHRYDRAQFENAWIPTSGGLAYIIHNDDQPLPATRTSNW